MVETLEKNSETSNREDRPKILNYQIDLDKKFIFTFSKDSTQKIWNLETGELLLTRTYLNVGNGMSIDHTPDGRFDYSDSSAKNYLQYMLYDKTANAFDTIDLPSIHKDYYTPKLMDKVLNKKLKIESKEYFADKMQNLPKIGWEYPDPQEEIDTDKNSMDIGFKLSDTGGGIGRTEVFVNGNKITSQFQMLTDVYTLSVPLVYGLNKVTVLAYNSKGMPKTLDIPFTRKRPINKEISKPKTFVLSIGINEYEDRKLTYSKADAMAMLKTLKEKGIHSEFVGIPLYGKDATKSRIVQELENISKLAKPNDVVIIYYSGHGNTAIKDAGGKLFYLVPADFDWTLPDKDSERVARNYGVDSEWISDVLGRIKAHKVVLILDACHSGDTGIALASKNNDKLDDTMEQLNRLANGTGRFLFTSSAGTEASRETELLGHGLFTSVLLKGLGYDIQFKTTKSSSVQKGVSGITPISDLENSTGDLTEVVNVGSADMDKNGFVDLNELNYFIQANFLKLTRPYMKNIKQTPPHMMSLGRDSFSQIANDFPVIQAK